MAALCNFWFSIPLQILSVSCWQWWPMTSTRPSAALCSMQSACPAGCAPCSWLAFIWCYSRHFDTHDISIPLMFLWVKWDFLWCCFSSISILLRYTDQWVSDIHCFWLHWTEYNFRSPCLLLLYYPISLEDPLCKSRVLSFLYLDLSPNFCGNFPGNNALYVFQAKFFLLSRSRQNDFFVLHPCDSHVKPSDL